jgi:hypothetical protein
MKLFNMVSEVGKTCNRLRLLKGYEALKKKMTASMEK